MPEEIKGNLTQGENWGKYKASMAYNQFLKNSTRFKSSNYDTRVMKLELGTSSKMEFVQ